MFPLYKLVASYYFKFECNFSHVKPLSRLPTTVVNWITTKIASCNFIWFHGKLAPLFFFCLKSCLFTFSCLNLMYLIIKLQKQDICIFKMAHDAENVTSNIAKCPLFLVLKFLSNCSFKVKSKASYFPRFPPRL